MYWSMNAVSQQVCTLMARDLAQTDDVGNLQIDSTSLSMTASCSEGTIGGCDNKCPSICCIQKCQAIGGTNGNCALGPWGLNSVCKCTTCKS